MKTILLLGVLAVIIQIQVTELPASEQPQSTNASTEYAVTERGAHHRVWERVENITGPNGEQRSIVHSYEEVATGLSFLNPQSGQWEDADESFTITPEGFAVAQRTQHQLIVSPVLNDAQGNVDVQTPDGKRLRSTILALNLHNRVTEEDLLLAEVSSNAVAHLVAPNEIMFSNAFQNFADVRVLNNKGEIHQDILINAGLNLQELAASGFATEASSLELWTEYLESPEPVVTSHTVPSTPDALTEHLDFGAMKMPGGKVYLKAGASQAGEINVSTRWMTISNRQFVVESIPLGKAEALFAQMPLKKSFRLQANARRNLRREPPAPALVRRKTETILMARADNRETTGTSAQVIWDPVMVNGTLTDMLFKGDTTYCVSGTAYMYGTTTIEGGTVLKFFTNTGWGLYLSGPLKCETSAYRPAIFTCTNDNSVGESFGTGNPTRTKCDYFANENYSLAFTNVFFRYANRVAVGGALMTFSDCQFVDCALAFDNESGQTNIVRNALVSKCDSVSDLSFAAEHVTFDQCKSLIKDVGIFSPMYLGNAYLTNCILTAVTNITNSTLQSSVRYTNSTGIFQIAGAGFYYLSSDSTNRNTGTTNINASLLANLKKKTTYPPIVLSNAAVSSDTTLSPQAQRDSDTPDLGYHYEPVDYLTYSFGMTNVNLTVAEGTAIASYYGLGILLCDDSSIISVGTPLTPNWFVRYSSVQEQPISFGSGTILDVEAFRAGSVRPDGTFRFTKFVSCSSPSASFHLWHGGSGDSFAYGSLLVRDCEFWYGTNIFSGNSNSTACLINNLFFKSAFFAQNTPTNINLSLSNNLFWNCSIQIKPQTSTNSWFVFNNNFDTCTFGNLGVCINGKNGYVNCNKQLNPTNVNNIVLGSFNYTNGPLGDFYQVYTNFLDMGNVTADVQSLYHFTTMTNQIKETNSTVDIGYHYVAVNGSGQPIDTDGDGTPDYREDANGNGSVDSGETDWQSYNSTNGLSGAAGLKVFTPLK